MINTLFSRPHVTATAVVAALALGSTMALADYRSDIGYTKLQQDLGASIPTGTGVVVSQVEGTQTVNGQNLWMPDITNAEFAGKTIINASNAGAGLYSGHATPVGQAFYGIYSSIAPAITSISAFSANDWVGTGFLKTVVGSGGAWPNLSTSRIANHSWVGSANPPPPDPNVDNYILRRVDWLIETDEFIQVVGLSNGNGSSSTVGLLASAYNVIAVGVSSGQHEVGSVAQDATYTAGRTRPDIVNPNINTSMATPGVAAAAALLVETGRANPGLSTDLVVVSVSSRPRGLIRSAESSEVIKAALMAGADRVTHNSAPNPTNLALYRGTVPDQTANGLDRRYGAGQLNIRNSYWIIAGGEQNSTEDGNMGANVASRGFDYDPGFGGSSGSNTTATYPLPIQTQPWVLTASLVWNLDIAGGSSGNFNPTATLRDLNLAVIDLGNGNAVVASSASAIENTENLWFVVPANAQYALRVTRTGSFNWDYGLAWQLLRDADSDGAYDSQDNCINVANPDQIDSDDDGFGNRCDADLNNNGFTNAADTTMFRQQLGLPSVPPTYNTADLNANGTVNSQDTVMFRQLLGSPPGPSGLAPQD